jgi:hypothetical protein
MHKNHLVGCAAGIAIALAVVALSGGSAGGLGILAAALVCPLVMTAAMFFLMGGTSHRDRRVDTSADVHTGAHR